MCTARCFPHRCVLFHLTPQLGRHNAPSLPLHSCYICCDIRDMAFGDTALHSYRCLSRLRLTRPYTPTCPRCHHTAVHPYMSNVPIGLTPITGPRYLSRPNAQTGLRIPPRAPYIHVSIMANQRDGAAPWCEDEVKPCLRQNW